MIGRVKSPGQVLAEVTVLGNRQQIEVLQHKPKQPAVGPGPGTAQQLRIGFELPLGPEGRGASL